MIKCFDGISHLLLKINRKAKSHFGSSPYTAIACYSETSQELLPLSIIILAQHKNTLF
jgi:hypothetical protein